MLVVDILFYDGKGNFKQEELLGNNMNQVESNADLLCESLEMKWGNPVSWRKRNHLKHSQEVLKVQIEDNCKEQFKDFLNAEGLFFKEVKYAKNLTLWRVDIPKEYNRKTIEELRCVVKVSDMPMVVAD